MKVGYPKECKQGEKRYLLTEDALRQLLSNDVDVSMEAGGGEAIGISDDIYRNIAREMNKESLLTICSDASEVYRLSDLIVMVKEPQPAHITFIKPNHTIFSYLHLTGNYELAKELVDTKATYIAFETVTSDDSKNPTPLLKPMSIVAGKQAISFADFYMQTDRGGSGKFPQDCHLTIIGMGNSGMAAFKDALGNRYGSITLIENNQEKRAFLINSASAAAAKGQKIEVLASTTETIRNSLLKSDVVIDGVLGSPGSAAPKLITQELLQEWGSAVRGAIFVTISIDQGSIIEDIVATSIAEPMSEYKGVRVIAVPNMPSLRAYSASAALAPLVTPYVVTIVNKGVTNALSDDVHLRMGLNIHDGSITMPEIRDKADTPTWVSSKTKSRESVLGVERT